jgi:hypothetical protein
MIARFKLEVHIMNKERLVEITELLQSLVSEVENATIENVPDCAIHRDLIENLKESEYWSKCWLSFVKYHQNRGKS